MADASSAYSLHSEWEPVSNQRSPLSWGPMARSLVNPRAEESHALLKVVLSAESSSCTLTAQVLLVYLGPQAWTPLLQTACMRLGQVAPEAIRLVPLWRALSWNAAHARTPQPQPVPRCIALPALSCCSVFAIVLQDAILGLLEYAALPMRMLSSLRNAPCRQVAHFQQQQQEQHAQSFEQSVPCSLAEHNASAPFLGGAPGAQAASTPLGEPADPKQPQEARPAQCQEAAQTSGPPHSGNNSHNRGSSQQGANRQLLSLSDGGQTGSHQAAPDQGRPTELHADGGSRHRPVDTLLQQSTKAPVSLQQSAKAPAQPRMQKLQHHAATRESHHAMEGLDAGAAGPLELPGQDWDRKDDLSWQTVLNAAGGQHGSIPEGSAAAGGSVCLAWQAVVACWLLELRKSVCLIF